MDFDLNDEKATDVLIWWVEGADGSINYEEEQAVEDILGNLDYSMETYYEESLQQIGGLGNDDLKDLVEEAIDHGSSHFDHHRKQLTMALLYAIAESNGAISDNQKEKLDRIQREFGVEQPEDSNFDNE